MKNYNCQIIGGVGIVSQKSDPTPVTNFDCNFGVLITKANFKHKRVWVCVDVTVGVW